MSEVKTNEAQDAALANLHRRECEDNTANGKPLRSYAEFRETVQPMFMGDGAIVVPWAGMFIAIETDGYTHS